MTTIGYIFILFAFLLIRAISRGRIENLPQDLGDAMTAIFTANGDALKEVANRTGGGLDTATPAEATASSEGKSGLGNGTGLLAEVKRLGSGAKGYRLGATGPTYYDCSGLVWRAMKNLNIYKGIRFTTHTFAIQSKSFATPVTSFQVGDIVLWENHHMGVVDSPTSCYSARSVKSGIKSGPLSVFTHEFRVTPKYYRLIAPGAGAGEGSGGGGGKSW
jgi:hypothetical protein